VDFFDRLQYYLQRAYDFYDLTEFSNKAEIKLLLLKVMAEALSTGGLHQGDEGEANQ
jgi:hypothetical protein